MQLLTGYETEFFFKLCFALLAGAIIGYERESRGKPAGISTNTLVIAGSMMFTFFSTLVDPASKSRIAAQIVTGVGFLGAGMILKGENGVVKNLTTAASVWLAAAIGMGIGFGFYVPALLATVFAFFVPMIPPVGRRDIRKTILKRF
jgi:putative Mg2+ transporter-C (MgtC) family protein